MRYGQLWTLSSGGLNLALWVALLFQPHVEEQFMTEGFCWSKHETVGFDSFELCFYIDMIGTALLLAIYWRFPKHRAMTSFLIPGILMHGIGHYKMFLNKTTDTRFVSTLSKIILFLFTFAFMFLVKCDNLKRIIISSIISYATFVWIPTHMVFNFTNTWINMIIIYWTSTDPIFDKKEYLGDIVLGFLNFCAYIVPFLEAFHCTSFLQNFGGHAVFDFMIALTTIGAALVDPYRPAALEEKK